MRKAVITAFCISIVVIACNKEKNASKPIAQNNYTHRHYAARNYNDTDTGSYFIPVTVANGMISSYLTSINASVNDTDVRSYTINADSLRAYISNTDIKNVKVIFAHTAPYIAEGYSGQNAGYQSGALTIIVAGYDASGNYVYYNGKVLDHVSPCPFSCASGNAGGDLIQ